MGEKTQNKGIHYLDTCGVYLILDDKIVLIDAGTDAGAKKILKYIESIGKKIEDIDLIINTHGHADHCGGNAFLKERTEAKVAAHFLDVGWIEDHERFFRESQWGRKYFSWFTKSDKVDILLKGGEKLKTGRYELEVIHTPGHTLGNICLYERTEKMLFAGDTIQYPPQWRNWLGIIEDVSLLEKSYSCLAGMDINILFSAHIPQVLGPEVKAYIQNCKNTISKIEETILNIVERKAIRPKDIRKEIVSKTGRRAVNEDVEVATIKAYLKKIINEERQRPKRSIIT